MSLELLHPQPPVVIRPARAEDLPELIDMMSAMVPDCLPETVWQLPWTWSAYVVAETPAGLAAAGSVQPIARGQAEIRGLVVRPSHRGQGLASEVVRELVSRAEGTGREAVCVTRKPGFFARLGFVHTPPTWMRPERHLFSKPGQPPRVGMRRARIEVAA